MHIENELVEYVSPVNQEYEEIVEEYEEEVLVLEEFLEPPVTYTADTTAAQGKPRCITLIFYNQNISICYAFTLQGTLWKPHAIYIPMSLTSAGSSSALLRFIGSVSNLPLLTICGYYYYYSHNKMMERKMVTGQGYGMGIGGCNRLCPVSTGHSLVALFSLSVSIEDCPLLWMVVRSQVIILSTCLLMGAGRLITLLSWVLALFGPTDWRRG
jgi:hypothetical protein